MGSIREARQYVERLLRIAEQGGDVEAVGQELRQLREVMESSAVVSQQVEYERQGIKQAVVETTIPLTGEKQQRLSVALQKLLGAPVAIQQQTNPEIIGGLRITVDDLVIDNSLRGRLAQMLQAVHQAPAPAEAVEKDE